MVTEGKCLHFFKLYALKAKTSMGRLILKKINSEMSNDDVFQSKKKMFQTARRKFNENDF